MMTVFLGQEIPEWMSYSITKEILIAEYSRFSENFSKYFGDEEAINKIYDVWIKEQERRSQIFPGLKKPHWFEKAKAGYGLTGAIEVCLRETFRDFIERATEEHVDSIFYLGVFHELGIGNAEKNLNLAKTYFRVAAGKGHLRAKNKHQEMELRSFEAKQKLEAYRNKAFPQGVNPMPSCLGIDDEPLPVQEEDEQVLPVVEEIIETTSITDPLKKKGVSDFLKAAKRGDLKAQDALGNCYRKGREIPLKEEAARKKRAFRWYAKAANQGLQSAQYHLGLCYEEDQGIPKEEKEKRAELSFLWYSKAAEQGHAKAQYHLGWYYECKQGIPAEEIERHDELAIQWYTKSAEQGNRYAELALGYYYQCFLPETSENQQLGFQYFLRSAEQGIAEAQYAVGLFYTDGVDKNMALAFEWFSKAAHQGEKNAQFSLGEKYLKGQDVPEDQKINKDEKAFYWIMEAAKQKHPHAQYYIGFFYENGISVTKDLKKAIYWYKRAAKNTSLSAQKRLTEVKDRSAAKKRNDKEAMYRLGTRYELEKKGIKARKWYGKAAALGHLEAAVKVTALTPDEPDMQDGAVEGVEEQAEIEKILKEDTDSQTLFYQFFDMIFDKAAVSGQVIAVRDKYLHENEDQRTATAAFIKDHYSWIAIFKSWVPGCQIILNTALNSIPNKYFTDKGKKFLSYAFQVYWDEICGTMIIAAINGHGVDDRQIRAEIVGCIVLGNAWKIPHKLVNMMLIQKVVTWISSQPYCLSSILTLGILKAQDKFFEIIPEQVRECTTPIFQRMITPMVCNAVLQCDSIKKVRFGWVMVAGISYGVTKVFDGCYDQLTVGCRHPYMQAVQRFGGGKAKSLH